MASLIWLATAGAAVLPAAAETMIPFLDDEEAARRAAVALTIVMPPMIGGLVATLHNHRGQGGGAARGTWRGGTSTPW